MIVILRPRILACWQPYLLVETYPRGKLTRTEWDHCFNRPPKDKVTTLNEPVEAAKKQQDLSG